MWLSQILQRGAPVAEVKPPEPIWDVDLAQVLAAPEGLSYQIAIDTFFSAAHHVTIGGARGGLHEHSFRLQVRIACRQLDPVDGTVLSFQTIDDAIRQVTSLYNHRTLNDLPPFRTLQPTSEALAAVMFQQLDRLLPQSMARLIAITLWESPTRGVTYGRDA